MLMSKDVTSAAQKAMQVRLTTKRAMVSSHMVGVVGGTKKVEEDADDEAPPGLSVFLLERNAWGKKGSGRMRWNRRLVGDNRDAVRCGAMRCAALRRRDSRY